MRHVKTALGIRSWRRWYKWRPKSFIAAAKQINYYDHWIVIWGASFCKRWKIDSEEKRVTTTLLPKELCFIKNLGIFVLKTAFLIFKRLFSWEYLHLAALGSERILEWYQEMPKVWLAKIPKIFQWKCSLLNTFLNILEIHRESFSSNPKVYPNLPSYTTTWTNPTLNASTGSVNWR